MTLLNDGKLLIVGGRDASHQAIASPEIYDPVGEVFIPVSPLGIARYGHQATLLPNHKVLVTGGGAIAEIFDPASGGWSFTFPADGIPGGDSATLLTNDQVLVIGGVDSAQKGISRLYDPTFNTWTRTGPLTLARRNHTATRLSDGRVLVCGGNDYPAGKITHSAEIYDPASGTWTSTGALTGPRHRHTATLLADGKILVCGGNNRDALASTELFDPATGIWTPASPLSIQRDNHTAILLPNSKILVCGGIPAASTVLATSELYDPATGNWTANDILASSRCLHVATRMPHGDILVTGGWGAYDRPAPGDFSLAIRDVETYGPPAPEIALLAGPTHLVTGETTDFGNVTLGGESIRRFTLKNVGSAALTNLSLSINGVNSAAFIATPDTLLPTLAAKSEISLSIRFSPSQAGEAAASLVIGSNDNNEGNFTVFLTGTGSIPAPPDIAVRISGKKDLTDGKAGAGYGQVKVGSSRTLSFTIQNTGTANLTGISIRKSGRSKNDFTIGFLAKTTLVPGASTTIRIAFNPATEGTRTANLRILSNDADESPFNIVLTGKGIKP